MIMWTIQTQPSRLQAGDDKSAVALGSVCVVAVVLVVGGVLR